uniref:Uncharacterized protein n=1 Tax=Aureoumbra lagunensis TaxID=44058 RepID=A0A7S3NN80_9STRA|mmetsp:Transcript_11564/g.15744  ORF Transcript_11564/g.15744 Transcript_11564/m.15744 type:complete len:168 (-) Transcript_11564:211-714(-)
MTAGEKDHMLMLAQVPASPSNNNFGKLEKEDGMSVLLDGRDLCNFKSNQTIAEVAQTLARHYEISTGISVHLQDKTTKSWKHTARVCDYGRGQYYVASSKLKESLLGGGSSSTEVKHIPTHVLASLDEFEGTYKYEGCIICYDSDYWKRNTSKHGPEECCPDLFTCC